MANLIANATGNISASSFGTTETATNANNFPSTGVPSTTNSTAIGTSEVFTPTFTTTNTKVCDAIMLYCFSANSATGTFTVALNNGTSDQATCVVNASDIPTTGTLVVFKLGSTVTLDGSANWKVGVKCSVASQVTCYRATSTANDYYKMLRLTTTATPASNDHVYITSGLTGQGTHNSFTITMDYTSNTIAPGQIDIGYFGNLTYGTSVSTNYYLQLNGNLYVWQGGTLNIGTVGTPIPSTSTAVLEFNCTVNVQYGLEPQAGSTVNTFGNSMSFTSTKLAADVAANGSSITTADNTGWAVGDTLAFASTTKTNTDAEAANINTISGTTITVTGGGGTGGALKNAHSGTNSGGFDTRAEVIDLTRNVKIRGISTANQSYVNIAAAAAVSFQWTEFYQLGSATANKRGIDVGTTTGSATFNGCSLHDYIAASSTGMLWNITTNANITVTSLVSYNITANHFNTVAISSATNSVNGWVAILNGASGSPMFNIAGTGLAFSNVTATSGLGNGISFVPAGVYDTKTVSNLVCHSCAAYGMVINQTGGTTFSNVKLWRNITSGGLQLVNSYDCVLDTWQVFGNQNGCFFTPGGLHNITLNNWTVDFKASAGDALTQANAFTWTTSGSSTYVLITNSTFGGSFPATATVNCSTGIIGGTIIFHNCTSNDTSLVTSQTALSAWSMISFQKFNGTAGNHKTYMTNGIISIDTTIFDIGPASQRLTPLTGSGSNLKSALLSTPVANATSVTFTIKVRCSTTSAGDAASYNGAAPQLWVRRNFAAGITADTSLATMSSTYLPGNANQGLWATVSGTTATVTGDNILQFYVTCDGNAGWINVDSASSN